MLEEEFRVFATLVGVKGQALWIATLPVGALKEQTHEFPGFLRGKTPVDDLPGIEIDDNAKVIPFVESANEGRVGAPDDVRCGLGVFAIDEIAIVFRLIFLVYEIVPFMDADQIFFLHDP